MPSRTLAVAALIAVLCACQAETDRGPEGRQESPASTTGSVSAARPADGEPRQANAADPTGCGADKLGRWLNLLPTETAKAEIAEAVGERPIRYYTRGDPITMDFSPERLNAELGVDGRIKLFRCG